MMASRELVSLKAYQMTWLFFPIPVIIYLVTNIFISLSQHCEKHETVQSDFRFKYLSEAKNCQKL